MAMIVFFEIGKTYRTKLGTARLLKDDGGSSDSKPLLFLHHNPETGASFRCWHDREGRNWSQDGEGDYTENADLAILEGVIERPEDNTEPLPQIIRGQGQSAEGSEGHYWWYDTVSSRSGLCWVSKASLFATNYLYVRINEKAPDWERLLKPKLPPKPPEWKLYRLIPTKSYGEELFYGIPSDVKGWVKKASGGDCREDLCEVVKEEDYR